MLSWGAAEPGNTPPAPQELFKKVVPYHCLGSIWSQRDKKGKEHLAPTVRATVTQFNNVANCVITTCLGDRSVTARGRARVVEHWIQVARVCRRAPGEPSAPRLPSGLRSVVLAPERPCARPPQGPAARFLLGVVPRVELRPSSWESCSRGPTCLLGVPSHWEGWSPPRGTEDPASRPVPPPPGVPGA